MRPVPGVLLLASKTENKYWDVFLKRWEYFQSSWCSGSEVQGVQVPMPHTMRGPGAFNFFTSWALSPLPSLRPIPILSWPGSPLLRPSSRAVGDLLGAHEGLMNSSQKFSLNGISQKSVSQQNLTKMFLTMKSLSKKGREGSPSLPRASQPPDLTKAFESSSSSCNSSTPSSPQVGTKAFNIIQHSLWSSNPCRWLWPRTLHPGRRGLVCQAQAVEGLDNTSDSRNQSPLLPQGSQVSRQLTIFNSITDITSLTARPMPPVSLERVVSPNPAVESVKSNDSDKTLSGSSDSIGTAYRMDSQVYLLMSAFKRSFSWLVGNPEYISHLDC